MCYRVANDSQAQIAKFIYIQIVQHRAYRTSYDITSSHTQIINLKVNILAASPVGEQVPDRDLVVRMRAIVRARGSLSSPNSMW